MAVPSSYYKWCRPTVSLVIAHRDQVAFVQPKKDPFRKTWILPQGGITFGESIAEAAIRETGEELGLDINGVHMHVLGDYVNELPRERHARKPKFMVCVGMRIDTAQLRPNEENWNAEWCSCPDAAFAMLAHRMTERPTRLRNVFRTLESASTHHLITWRCKDIIAVIDGARPLQVA